MSTYRHREHAAPRGRPLLVLLHGTGGDENQFFELGRQLMPEAGLLAPRGDVSEAGAARFFRRRAEGQYDMADLARATAKMAGFVREAAARTGASGIIGLGYSNGANILASVLLDEPGLFDAAVLMHPLIPFEPAAVPALADKRVLITAGRRDPICPPALTERLAATLTKGGAAVTLAWHEGGHEIRNEEIAAVETFLGEGAVEAAA
ncbi:MULTISPECIES: alpha/beta hydrolase [unclassified Aureimonas]|uniref:alpha/beta hydrolase n=1 Tax=unclassified Aureimonas TaxID=2615206 RepID=UPI0006FD1477|nr:MULTISPECIES: alpha/beta hydrolase [unclassified Aureimonas]KQT65767.1 esterase [Aureimonas sp. Leaf427]KQT74767.1 esterase [Aureimonas sp. Leaf460]